MQAFIFCIVALVWEVVHYIFEHFSDGTVDCWSRICTWATSPQILDVLDYVATPVLKALISTSMTD